MREGRKKEKQEVGGERNKIKTTKARYARDAREEDEKKKEGDAEASGWSERAQALVLLVVWVQ
jgi:hypothetical protein